MAYEYFYNGGGVAVGDFNKDGLPDVYLTGNQVPNKLFINQGNLNFDDVTEQAGVAGRTDSWKTGVTLADVNTDRGYQRKEAAYLKKEFDADAGDSAAGNARKWVSLAEYAEYVASESGNNRTRNMEKRSHLSVQAHREYPLFFESGSARGS